MRVIDFRWIWLIKLAYRANHVDQMLLNHFAATFFFELLPHNYYDPVSFESMVTYCRLYWGWIYRVLDEPRYTIG